MTDNRAGITGLERRVMKEFVKNNVIVICATIIILWAISAVTVLIITGNFMTVRSLVTLLTPTISSLFVLLGISGKVGKVRDEVKGGLNDVKETITNGDVTDSHP